MSSNLKKNTVNISGILIQKEHKQGVNANGKEYLSAKLTVRVGEGEHKVEFYANKLTKDGNISKLYDSLTTVVNDYKSAEEVGIDNADRVHITNAEVSINRYVDDMGQLRESRKINGKFCSRHTSGEFTEKAYFELLGVVYSTQQITNEDGELDLVKIKLIVDKGYNNQIDIIEVVVREKDALDYVAENFTKGRVLKTSGDLVNKREEVAPTKATNGFGMSKQMSKGRVVNELLADYGDIIESLEEQEPFTMETVSKQLEQFNQKLEEIKSTPKTKVQVGFGNNSNDNKFAQVNDDVIPW